MASEKPADEEEVCLFLEGGKLPRKLPDDCIDYTVKHERAVLTLQYADKQRIFENLKRRGVTVVTLRRFLSHAKGCKMWLDTPRARISRLHREHVKRAAGVTERERTDAIAVYASLQAEESKLLQKHKRELEELHQAQTKSVENLVRVFGRGPFNLDNNLYDPFQTRTGRLILKRRAARTS